MKKYLQIIIVFLLSLNLYANGELEKVTVQLDWKYQFQYAGFIAAVEKGFYKDAGFNVKLLEYKHGIDTVDEVLSGRADFGIHTSPLIIKDKKLLPTVNLATYLHQSPLVLVMQRKIKSPKDLLGKKIMATQDEFESGSISFLLKDAGINKNNTTFIEHTFNIKDFKNKKVDAMSAYLSDEICELEQENIFYTIVNPSDYGYATNALNLFTSYENVKKNPKKIQRFIDATNKGWKYAIAHTDELIDILHVKYKSQKSIKALQYEAKIIKKLMLLDLYGIGQVDESLMKRLYTELVQSGKLSKSQKLEQYLYSQIIKNSQSNKIFFTKEERDFLAKKGTIKLCVDPVRMPFEGIENGKYAGMVAEYFDLIKKKINFKIKVYPTQSWDETIKAMKSRKCDIIASATPTPSRLKYMNFTKPYMTSPIVLITKIDQPFIAQITDVSKKKLGITKGYAIEEILKKKYPQMNIVEVKNIEDGLKKVESGEIYGYIGNLSVTVSNIQKSFHGLLKVSARLEESDDLTIGSRNDEPLLNTVFQKIIQSIDKAKVREILNRWISVKESVEIDYVFLWKIFGAIFVVFLLFAIYGYQLKLNNRKLKKLSREDALTRVGNRLRLNEVLEDSYQHVQRYENHYGVILLDIDDFKKVNDTYGHLFGDEVLKKFTQILTENIRQTDKLGRWGGEEFLIVCPNTNQEDLRKVAENLRSNIENNLFLKEKSITASFGLSTFDKSKNIEQVVNEADENLYKAKASGKNRVC